MLWNPAPKTLKDTLDLASKCTCPSEKGRIVISYCEGKTKLYQLNPAYPLLSELEQLLKKTYTLLPPQEKKLYSLVQQDASERKISRTVCSSLFGKDLKRLSNSLAWHNLEMNRGGMGREKERFLSASPTDTTLVFHERGSWQIKQGQDISFSNTFRWTLDRSAGMISLEHLRLGPEHPVFLFHLIPIGTQLLASVDSHLCEEDVYLATVPWDRYSIRLNWRVIGPKKNEEMEYCYT